MQAGLHWKMYNLYLGEIPIYRLRNESVVSFPGMYDFNKGDN